MISEITIANITVQPTHVYNRWVNNTPQPAQGDVEATFVYFPDTFELYVFDLNVPVDDGLTINVSQTLLEVTYA